MNILLDFNLFSFDENYYNTQQTSQILGFLITLLGAAFGAWIGFRFYIKQDKDEKKKKNKIIKDYFIETVEQAVKNVELQIKVYKDSIEIQKEDLFNYKPIKRVFFKYIEYLSKLNISDLYEIFPKDYKYNKTEYYNILLYIDLIQNIIKETENIANQIQTNYHKSVEIIAFSFGEIFTLLTIEKYFKENNSQNNLKEINKIDFLIKSINKIKLSNYKDLESGLLKEFCSKEYISLFDRNHYEQFKHYADTISNNLIKIEKNNEDIEQILNEKIKSLKEQLIIIVKIIDEIKKYNSKIHKT